MLIFEFAQCQYHSQWGLSKAWLLLIENVNTTFIKIVPVETIRNPIDENDERRGEIYYEMEPLIINIAQ